MSKTYTIRVTQDLSGHYEGSIEVEAKSPEAALKKLKRMSKQQIDDQDMEGNEVKIWSSMREAAEFFGVKRASLLSCIKGKCKTIKKFKWKFYEEIF